MGSKYKYEDCVKPHLKKILKWRSEGMTEKRISEKLCISQSTFVRFKEKHEELKKIVAQANQDLSDEVENSLYKRAKGYEYEEVRTTKNSDGEITKTETFARHMPPDPKALAMALAILKRDKYKYFEIEKLKLEREKLELLREKAIPQSDYEAINNNITNIAELLTNPSPPRKPKVKLEPLK